MFIEAKTVIESDLPHFDVMRQAAGEIIERSSPAGLSQHSHIHLKAGQQFNRAFGGTVTPGPAPRFPILTKRSMTWASRYHWR